MKILRLLLLLLFPCFADSKIEINKKDGKLILFENDKIIKEYKISMGGNYKSGKKELVGDEKTPEGNYLILNINAGSKFGIFLLLNYPNIEDIKNGFKKGTIDSLTMVKMIEEFKENGIATQNSKLGGNIGIHGALKYFRWIGKAHTNFNWTKGCIAVTDDEIREITKNIKIGTKVFIKK